MLGEVRKDLCLDGYRQKGEQINMINKVATLLLILSVFTLAFARPTLAQSVTAIQDKKTAKIKDQVKNIIAGEKVTKKVKLNNGTIHRGFLSSATDVSFVVQDKTGGTTTIKYSDVDSITKKDVSTGLKIGIGAAAGAAAIILLYFFSARG